MRQPAWVIKRLPRMQGARVSAAIVIDDAQHDQPAAPAPELPGQLAANGMLPAPVLAPVADRSAIALKPLDVTPQPRIKLPPVLGANEAGTVAVAKYKLTASIQMSAHLASVRALKNMRRAGRNSKKRARRNSTLATGQVQPGEGRMQTNPAVQVEHFEFSSTEMSTFVVHPDSLRRVLGRIRDQHDDPSSTPPASTHWFNMAGFNADSLNVFRDVFRMRPEAIDQVCEKIDIPMCTYFQDDLDSLAGTRFETDDGSVVPPCILRPMPRPLASAPQICLACLTHSLQAPRTRSQTLCTRDRPEPQRQRYSDTMLIVAHELQEETSTGTRHGDSDVNDIEEAAMGMAVAFKLEQVSMLMLPQYNVLITVNNDAQDCWNNVRDLLYNKRTRIRRHSDEPGFGSPHLLFLLIDAMVDQVRN